jgi:hypothetical protein
VNLESKTFQLDTDPDATYYYATVSEIHNLSKGVFSTSGAATTLTTADAATFAMLTASTVAGRGDQIIFMDDAGATHVRSVLTRSGTSITISGANVTVTSKPFSWRAVRGGTGANDGWHDTLGAEYVTVQVRVATRTSTSIEFQVEARSDEPGALAIPIGTAKSFNGTAPQGDYVEVPKGFGQVRCGIKSSTDAAGDSCSAFLLLSR